MNQKLFTLVLFFTIFLVSCGGSAPSTTIDVTMTDFAFTPNTFTIAAGKEITLNVLNNGAVVHNFIIMKLGVTAGDTFGDEDQENVFWEERDIQPGGDFSVIFTAPTEPGEYQVVCRTAGHIASGMVGKLVVVAGE
jgi:plastocyanin